MTSSAALPGLAAPADAELITAVRGGDLDAFGELFARHVDAARRLARQLVTAPDVDDLVSDAFGKVLGVLQRGGGPDLAFRAYLLTTLRRVHVDRLRAGARLRSTDDLTPYDAGVPFRDTAVEHFESSTAARAFASLPERWQLVLWHLEVEGQKPAEVAPLLGMTPNSVSALAYRAREGLRQAFVAMHARDVGDDADGACARTRAELGGFVRGALSRRDRAKVESHLEQCRACAGVYLELSEVNADLAAVLAPLVLGTAAASYLAAVSTAGVTAGWAGSVLSAVSGWTGSLPGRVREALGSQGPAAATAGVVGVAVTAAVVGGVVVATRDDGSDGGSPPASVRDLPRDERRQPSAEDPADGERNGPTASTGPEPVAAAASTPVSTPSAPAVAPTQLASPTADPPPAEPPSPGPTPGQPSPGQPTPGEPTPAGVDASVSVATRDLAGLVWGVDVAVRGLPPDVAGRLVIDTDAPAVALTLDRRCGLLQLGRARCRVRGPATYRFLAVPLPVVATTLTFRLEHDGREVDPSDDAVRVRLHR